MTTAKAIPAQIDGPGAFFRYAFKEQRAGSSGSVRWMLRDSHCLCGSAPAVVAIGERSGLHNAGFGRKKGRWWSCAWHCRRQLLLHPPLERTGASGGSRQAHAAAGLDARGERSRPEEESRR
ncbi:hypothetical protein MTO96_009997 [Rhipicephalus appendiculatus]